MDSLKKVLPVAGNILIPNLFDRFHLADKTYDDREAVFKAIFNPAGHLNKIEGIKHLGLVDATAHLRTQSGIVSEILQVLTTLENTQATVKMQDLRQNLQDIPYGWPCGPIQLSLAVLFRCGQIGITHKGNALYDYRQLPDAAREFSRITSFDALEVRTITEILSPQEIQAAYLFCKNILKMTTVSESVNDIFLHFRDWRIKLDLFKTTVADLIAEGLPLPNPVQNEAALLDDSLNKNKPQELVKWLLDHQSALRNLQEEASLVQEFLKNNKMTLQNALSLIKRAEASQVLRQRDKDGTVFEAVRQLNHLMSERRVVSSWAEFQTYRSGIENAYRSAYEEIRDVFKEETQSLGRKIREHPGFNALSPEKRKTIDSKWFGHAGLTTAGVSFASIETLSKLLEADQATSLDALSARLSAVPALLGNILADTKRIAEPVSGGAQVNPKWRMWRPKSVTPGMTIKRDEAAAISEKFRQELESQFDDDVEEVIIQ